MTDAGDTKDATRNMGGRPTNEERRRKKNTAAIQRAVDRLPLLLDSITEGAVNPETPASIRPQLVQTVVRLVDLLPEVRTAITAGSTVSERAAAGGEPDETQRKMLVLLVKLGLWGHGEVPMVGAMDKLSTIPGLKAKLDSRIAELDAKEREIKERLARINALDAHLDQVERRELRPAAIQSEPQPPTPPEIDVPGASESGPQDWWPLERTQLPSERGETQSPISFRRPGPF